MKIRIRRRDGIVQRYKVSPRARVRRRIEKIRQNDKDLIRCSECHEVFSDEASANEHIANKALAKESYMRHHLTPEEFKDYKRLSKVDKLDDWVADIYVENKKEKFNRETDDLLDKMKQEGLLKKKK